MALCTTARSLRAIPQYLSIAQCFPAAQQRDEGLQLHSKMQTERTQSIAESCRPGKNDEAATFKETRLELLSIMQH